MASNQYVNKVVYGSTTLIDLTSDTVTASDILTGKTAHDKSGAPITGSCAYDANTKDATAGAAEILATKTAYVNGSKVTGTMTNQGKKTLTISSKTDSLTIPAGYHDGTGKASISTAEQAKLIPGNILSGITILGVTGSVSPSSDIHIESTKSVTPTIDGFTVMPASGYQGMAQVNVEAIPYSEVDNAQGGKTVTIAPTT